MADNTVDFILRARDQASAVIAKAHGGITGLTGAVAELSAKAGLLGAFTTGIVGLGAGVVAAGKQFADLVESLDRMSVAIGVPIDQLQVLHEVFRRAGLSAEDADKALTFMARAIGRGDPILKKLGITTRDVLEATLQFGDALARGSDNAAKQQLALKIMGKSSSEAVGTLETLRTQVDAVGGQMDKLGGKLSPGMTDKARELDRQLDDLGTAWLSMSNRALSAVVPWATKIITVFGSVATAVYALTQQFALFFDVVSGRVDLFDKKVRRDTFERLQTIIGEIAKALAAADGVIKGPLGPGPSLKTKAGDEILQGALAEDGTGRKSPKATGPPELIVLPEGSPLRVAADLATAQETLAGVTALSNAEIDKQVAALARVQEGMTDVQRASLEATVVFLEWQEAAATVTSSAAIMSDGLRAVWTGLESGFLQVAANLTNRAQTLSSALKTIFSSLVGEILAMLARLAAAKVFEFILNLLLPFAGTAASVGIQARPAGTPLPGGMPSPIRPSRAGPTIIVNAIDVQSITDSHRSYRGGFHRFGEDLAVTGALS